MDPEKNSKPLTSIIGTFIAIILLLFAVIDFTITQPKIRNSVKRVAVEFDSMKVYLDTKLPEIDSALIQHQKEIYSQTEYLKELNEVSNLIIDN